MAKNCLSSSKRGKTQFGSNRFFKNIIHVSIKTSERPNKSILVSERKFGNINSVARGLVQSILCKETSKASRSRDLANYDVPMKEQVPMLLNTRLRIQTAQKTIHSLKHLTHI